MVYTVSVMKQQAALSKLRYRCTYITARLSGMSWYEANDKVRQQIATDMLQMVDQSTQEIARHIVSR